MKATVKWWHWLIALSLVGVLCAGLWRSSMEPKAPNIKDVPKGANADNALTINMDGG